MGRNKDYKGSNWYTKIPFFRKDDIKKLRLCLDAFWTGSKNNTRHGMILLADNKILNIISISNLSIAAYDYLNGI